MPITFFGIDLAHPLNRIKAGACAVASNVRSYGRGFFNLRTPLSTPIITVDSTAGAIVTLARLNDTTNPSVLPSGYTILSATEAGTIFNNSTPVATGLTGNPVSMVPFRPNTSVQPWMYIGDDAPQNSVVVDSSYACTGNIKVRSDGLSRKTGIREPQVAPVASSESIVVPFSGPLLATAIPWTNYPIGTNPDYGYGETEGYPNITPPVDGTVWFGIDVEGASTVTITSLTGSATINGGTKTPTSLGPAIGPTNPGGYIRVAGTGLPPATATVVTGAFVNASGYVLPQGVAPQYIPPVVDVGASIGTPITVPTGAVSFQIGINSTGNTFSDNSGSFSIAGNVTTNALPSALSVVGNLTLYWWGDSPTSGPVGAYIWCNPDDPGGGSPRTISNAAGSYSGNSFIFDCTFTGGVPGGPGIGNGSQPMIWSQLNPDESVSGTISLPSGQTANFNFCLYGSIYVPAAGNYSFELTSKDDCIWGIEGATYIPPAIPSGPESFSTSLSGSGQTITVVKGYPLLPRQDYINADDGKYAQTTVVVNFAAAGVYGIEVDYDYWYRNSRILLLGASPTPGAPISNIIPPSPQGVRTDISYAYVYRASETGAQSNPSPTSPVQVLPALGSTITPTYSPDPQVDKIDYYRQDAGLANYTYVATGPNTNPPTPIFDDLSDLAAAGNQILQYDNFEPVPSIDLPQAGICNVSGGVITWVSGGAIGGGSTGFNTRWLAGTVILIGYPTQLAYTLIARPTSDTEMTIPGVPDGTNLVYDIAEPILAAQPLAYLFGPTDNINFAFGVGDPLRPGTLYWCKGSNLDSWPDSNQSDVTSPDEALVNGVMTEGLASLFSITRGWVVEPNFFNALATVTGTEGSTWSNQATAINRGLFMPRCLVVEGGSNVFARVDDGIIVSPGGQGSKSLTNECLYPLFKHEGTVPQPITRNGITVWPPDDSLPEMQKFSQTNGYLSYDYYGTDGNPHSMVFDIASLAFVWDMYDVGVTARASNEGLSTQGFLVGCVDGTIRLMEGGGSEVPIGTVVSPAFGGVGWMHTRLITVEYTSNAPVVLSFVCPDQSTNGSIAPAAIILPSTGGTVTKWKTLPTANKWKLLQCIFTFTDPTFQLYIDGLILNCKIWGSTSEYQPLNPFGESGGEGGQP